MGEVIIIHGMSTVLEIEQAIDHLPPQDFRILASWDAGKDRRRR
jgi:hypothetical protein